MKLSDKGVKLVQQFEGYRGKAYLCPAGRWTIGYGTTKLNGKPVTPGMTCTKAQATEWLRKDVARFEKSVAKYDSGYHWTQNEFDALTVFAYNIGSIDGLTDKGTRTKAEIAQHILAYNKARVDRVLKPLLGLTRRRKAECKLFLTK